MTVPAVSVVRLVEPRWSLSRKESSRFLRTAMRPGEVVFDDNLVSFGDEVVAEIDPAVVKLDFRSILSEAQ